MGGESALSSGAHLVIAQHVALSVHLTYAKLLPHLYIGVNYAQFMVCYER